MKKKRVAWLERWPAKSGHPPRRGNFSPYKHWLWLIQPGQLSQVRPWEYAPHCWLQHRGQLFLKKGSQKLTPLGGESKLCNWGRQISTAARILKAKIYSIPFWLKQNRSQPPGLKRKGWDLALVRIRLLNLFRIGSQSWIGLITPIGLLNWMTAG